MFNFGFLELAILAVIGLIVLGPEQFPKAARGLIRLINELKRAFSSVQMDFDDIRRETTELLQKTEEEIRDTARPKEERAGGSPPEKSKGPNKPEDGDE